MGGNKIWYNTINTIKLQNCLLYTSHVEEVPVDLGETSGDIFKVGSVKTGKQDERGKDIWEDVFSLSKPLLNKMAMAAGIQFNPKETYGERIDRRCV